MRFVYKSRFKEDWTTDIDLRTSGEEVRVLLNPRKASDSPRVYNRDLLTIENILSDSLPKLRQIAKGKTSKGEEVRVIDIDINSRSLDKYSFPDLKSIAINTIHRAYIVNNAIYDDTNNTFSFSNEKFNFDIYNNLVEIRCMKIYDKEITKQSLWAVTYLSNMDAI